MIMKLKNFLKFSLAKRNVADIEHVENISVVDCVVLQMHLDRTTYV